VQAEGAVGPERAAPAEEDEARMVERAAEEAAVLQVPAP
jgi:hypothetical protein